jgi:hypothetical protein
LDGFDKDILELMRPLLRRLVVEDGIRSGSRLFLWRLLREKSREKGMLVDDCSWVFNEEVMSDMLER